MTMYTVDVYSGSPDSVIRDPHAQGVIVKATQGTGYVNPKCNHQWDLAGQLGKKRGLYHYAGGGDPISEAQFFISNIKNYVGKAILILDWESYQNASWGNTNWARQFVDEVHRLTGTYPLIYVQESAIWQVANCANDCGLWVAKYASMDWNSWTVPNMSVSSGAFKFITGWQYTGGDIDRSLFYVTADGWHALAMGNSTVKHVVQPTPAPADSKAKPSVPVETTWKDSLGVTWHAENGKFVVSNGNQLHLRWGATPSSTVIGVLTGGDIVKYDAWAWTNGFVYVRQPRPNGQYGYVAVRDARTNEPFGKFE